MNFIKKFSFHFEKDDVVIFNFFYHFDYKNNNILNKIQNFGFWGGSSPDGFRPNISRIQMDLIRKVQTFFRFIKLNLNPVIFRTRWIRAVGFDLIDMSRCCRVRADIAIHYIKVYVSVKTVTFIFNLKIRVRTANPTPW